jgi:hypothetical protein
VTASSELRRPVHEGRSRAVIEAQYAAAVPPYGDLTPVVNAVVRVLSRKSAAVLADARYWSKERRLTRTAVPINRRPDRREIARPFGA